MRQELQNGVRFRPGKSQFEIFDDAVGDIYHAIEILDDLIVTQEGQIGSGESPRDEAIQERVDALQELSDGLQQFIDTDFDPHTLDA